MSNKAKIVIDGKEAEFPVVVGSENEMAIDVKTLRARNGPHHFR